MTKTNWNWRKLSKGTYPVLNRSLLLAWSDGTIQPGYFNKSGVFVDPNGKPYPTPVSWMYSDEWGNYV